MAQRTGRMIETAAVKSQEWARLDANAKVLWLLLVLHGDDNQAMPAEVALIRATCFPFELGRVRESNVQRWLDMLQAAGYVRFYSSGGRRYVKALKTKQRLTFKAVPMVPTEDDGPPEQAELIPAASFSRHGDPPRPPREEKGKKESCRVPTREAVFSWFDQRGLSESESDKFINYNDALSWKVPWKKAAELWITRGQEHRGLARKTVYAVQAPQTASTNARDTHFTDTLKNEGLLK